MDYIREESDTDKAIDELRRERQFFCGACGASLLHSGRCPICSVQIARSAADISAELQRAEAAAVEACKRVAQPFNDALMYEDELPADMPDADYSSWFCASRLVYGVRMGPRYAKRVQPEEPSATA